MGTTKEKALIELSHAVRVITIRYVLGEISRVVYKSELASLLAHSSDFAKCSSELRRFLPCGNDQANDSVRPVPVVEV